MFPFLCLQNAPPKYAFGSEKEVKNVILKGSPYEDEIGEIQHETCKASSPLAEDASGSGHRGDVHDGGLLLRCFFESISNRLKQFWKTEPKTLCLGWTGR